MEGNPEPEGPALSEAAVRLMMAAGRHRTENQIRAGLEAMSKRSTETTDLLAAFLEECPEMAGGFMRRAGIEAQPFRDALQGEFSLETAPEPRATVENPGPLRRRLEEIQKRFDEERAARGDAPAFSGPLVWARQIAKEDATAREVLRIGVGSLVDSSLEFGSNAHELVGRSADPNRLVDARTWLRRQADPDAPSFADAREELSRHMNRMLDTAWPQIRRENNSASNRLKDEAYERDPKAYEEPLDLVAEWTKTSPDADQAESMKAWTCMRAAENEARIRRAPEATLDHLLIALLRDGSETAAFLDRQGVDRVDWASRLDAALPRFDEGPRWPPRDRALGMSLPQFMVSRLAKPLPQGKTLRELSREERREYVCLVPDDTRRFTDLVYLEALFNEPETQGGRLLREAGIDLVSTKAERIGLERDDPNWWQKPPKLVAELRRSRETSPMPDFDLGGIYTEAAAYETRMRGSSEIELDDLLVALLVPGTDLAALVREVGLDPEVVREEIGDLRPRLESVSRLPEGDWIALDVMLAQEGFSDLLFTRVRPLSRKRSSPGLELLRSYGITPERVDARLEELGIETK